MNFKDTPFCSAKSNFGKIETGEAQKLERMLNTICFTDDNCNPYPALETSGCGCCKQYLPVTAENIQKAKNDAQKWLEFLEKLEPVDYPPDVEFGNLAK